MKTMQRFGGVAVLAGALALLAGCGGGYDPSGPPSPPPPPPNPREVDATPGLAFSPQALTVEAGDEVTFAFGSVGHNVFFDTQTGAPADIGGINAGVSVTRVFPTAGVFHFTCHIHPGMAGTVTVQAPHLSATR